MGRLPRVSSRCEGPVCLMASLRGWVMGQQDGVSGAVPRQWRDLGLVCDQLGGSWESAQPRAVKSALPLIQERSQG